MKNAARRKIFSCMLPPALIDRVHIEAARTRLPIQTLVESALEKTIPRDIRVVVRKSRRATDESTQANG
jgi:hypothetical protein